MTRVSNLFRLQTTDSQIDSHDSRLAEIERNLHLHPELDAAQAEESAARAAMESARQILRRAEEEARRQQQRIAETDAALYSGTVRNPKELQGLQEETAALRRYLDVLEERQLEAMMAFEETEKNLSASVERRAEQERLQSEAERRLRGEQAQLQSARATFVMQREAAVAAVSAEDLEKYAAVRNAKRGVAVVRLEGGSCSGCGVAPSAARIDSARSGQEIVQCGNCGRILYLG